MAFPFRKVGSRVTDDRGVECCLYPNVVNILSTLRSLGVQLGIASRVTNIAGAYLLLQLFGIRCYFWPCEIYPTSKTLHFDQIKRKTGLEFSQMAFFDDDKRNLRDLRYLELHCVHVPKGLQWSSISSLTDDENHLSFQTTYNRSNIDP